MIDKDLLNIILDGKYDVDISFLKDKDISNYYLNILNDNYTNWNNRLIYYNNLFSCNNISNNVVPDILKDLTNFYYVNIKYNSNYESLYNNIEKIKDKLAQFYKCSEDEICMGDYDGKYKIINGEKVCYYKVILGSAHFDKYDITNLGNLELILGNCIFENSSINNIGNLRVIGRNAILSNFQINTLNKLKIIGNDAYFDNSGNIDTGNLTIIMGNAFFDNSQIEKLNTLKVIGKDAIFSSAMIKDLGALSIIGGNALFYYSIMKNLGKLQVIGKDAYLAGSEITSFGNLKIVWNKLHLDYSKTIDLGSINLIGYMTSYNIYEQRNIYDLEFYKDFNQDKKIRKACK